MASRYRQKQQTAPPAAGAMAARFALKRDIRDHDLLADGLRSEWNYFSAGAACETDHFCRFAHMPGLAHMPAACVGFLKRWPDTPVALDNCLTAIEARFRELGARWYRLYIHAPDQPVTAALIERGYAARKEVIHVRRAGPIRDWDSCTLEAVRVETDRHWAEKLDIHCETELSSDGHDFGPKEWVEMERRKAGTGALDVYLLRQNGRAVATTGFVPVSGSVIRAKNLLVRPDARRSGIGREAVRFYFDQTVARGATHVLLLSVAGTGSERLYNSMGAWVVGTQMEFLKQLNQTGRGA